MANISIDFSNITGRIKPMNAVNNGPVKSRSDQSRGNFCEYSMLNIPYARIHDANLCYSYGGPHCADIHAIFPDFNADENDPASYDFHLTDEYLSNMRAAGTQVYYRLGASIEHWSKKYDILPPPDFAKWARICEHVIMHYNEGWANGFNWNIEYWEIWNEPDLDPDDSPNKRCWGGTKAQFFELYSVTATYLKSRFPAIKVGGPAIAGKVAWGTEFIEYMAKNSIPLDFFSWHRYTVNVKQITDLCDLWRKTLDDNGFTRTESILNEWNYVRNWNTEWLYSIEKMTGMKGAAFAAAVMCACQNAPLDLLMYYDARVNSAMNCLFSTVTLKRLKGFYGYYAFARLAELGSQTAVSCDDEDIYTLAARDAAGNWGLMVVYYTDDDNAFSKEISITTGVAGGKFNCRMVDDDFSFEPVWPNCSEDGTLSLRMKRHSILFITPEKE
ncbi:MAG: hypothetical protein IJY46_11285 [Lentisphaeria bacterium]|nr:hypothetical protein [Lentisphaeria bacterium]